MMETLGSMIGMYKEEEVDISSKKLISLNESNELVLDNIKEIRDSYVISIIGDARKGKSTFLNCMINYLTRKNKEYFKVESTLKHCTIGMDYLSIEVEDKKYLFVDCQGLNYENSSNDYKYLLFLYSISNVIIYNEMKIVNNGIFATLQSMAMFVKNFDGFTKDCSLYIRVADYDYEEDVELLKDILFSDEEDQFDNVRKSIKKLFNEEIYITETYSLDRSEKELLCKNIYNSILDIKENNFKICIEKIYGILDRKELINVNLESLVDIINNNKKISFSKLDIYTATTNLEIKEFIEENFYKNELYNDWVFHSEIKIPYNCDGLNETRKLYDDILHETNEIKNKFNRMYSTVPDEIKIEFIIKYNEILDVVQECVEKNIEIAINDGNVLYKKIEKLIWKEIIKNFDIYKLDKIEYENLNYKKYEKKLNSLDYDAKEKLYKKYTELIDEINSKNEEIYNYNINIIGKINSDLCEIKYDICELIRNKEDYGGDYEVFIGNNDPYEELTSDNYKYKKFNKEGNIVEYSNDDVFNKIYDQYYDNYVTESYKYYDMFDKKNRELLNDKYFVKNELKYFEGYDILEYDSDDDSGIPIKSDNIYYVKFVLCENIFGEFKDTCVMELTTFMNMFDEKEKIIILNVIEDIVEDNVINLCLDNMKLSNKLIERLMLDLQVKIMNNETFVKYMKDFDVVKKRFNL